MARRRSLAGIQAQSGLGRGSHTIRAQDGPSGGDGQHLRREHRWRVRRVSGWHVTAKVASRNPAAGEGNAGLPDESAGVVALRLSRLAAVPDRQSTTRHPRPRLTRGLSRICKVSEAPLVDDPRRRHFVLTRLPGAAMISRRRMFGALAFLVMIPAAARAQATGTADRAAVLAVV